MKREILFGHRLIVWDILTIYKVLLSHLQLPLSLSILKFLHICCRPNRDLIENLLVSSFIIVFVVTEIKMSLPQFILHLNIILSTCLSRCRPPSQIGSLKIRSMRCFLRISDLRIPNGEMSLLYLLGNLFI